MLDITTGTPVPRYSQDGHGFQPGARRVAFVTLGQSPRPDLVPDILSRMDVPVEPTEIGLLDDLDTRELAKARPGPDEPAFLSRLRDGRQVELSVGWTRERCRRVYDRIGSTRPDLVVMMSASCGTGFRHCSATLESDRVVVQAIEAFSRADLGLGVIVPLPGLLNDLQPIGGPWKKARVQAARHGDRNALRRAARELAECDIVVLHSLGYSDADREAVAGVIEAPVILNRHLVANAIRDALDRLNCEERCIGRQPLAGRLRSLSDRERQTMYLVAEGLSNKEIARRIRISHRTVEIHRARMMEKMGFSSVSELVRTVDMITAF